MLYSITQPESTGSTALQPRSGEDAGLKYCDHSGERSKFKLGKSQALAWIVWVCKVSQGTLERLPDKRDNDHIDECWQGMSDTGRGRPL